MGIISSVYSSTLQSFLIHRFSEAQVVHLLLVCLITCWTHTNYNTPWKGIPQLYHEWREEPPSFVCLECATCYFHFLLLNFWTDNSHFHLNFFRTVIILNIFTTYLLSHLFSRLRNGNLCSFSKYGNCSRPFIILVAFCTFSCYTLFYIFWNVDNDQSYKQYSGQGHCTALYQGSEIFFLPFMLHK